jgi:23S rRNA (adenine2503-C2)-methyltransferase
MHGPWGCLASSTSELRRQRDGRCHSCGVDQSLLQERLAERGEPAFRARQVWEWAARGAGSYEEMTNLPLALRERLADEVPFSSLRTVREARASDGTEKALFMTGDGRPVEAVLMRYRDGRRSLCLSSQSGCPLTCSFCATGQMRFGRNLTASEILDQALHFRRKSGAQRRSVTGGGTPPDAIKGRDWKSRRGIPNHAVFMGMGEPLMNLDAVLAACERLPEVGIATSNTAISTVGWLPGIERMAAEGPPVRLALSLHAADETLRSELMPVNERYPLRDVLAACLRWHERRRRQVFVEYLMLGGVNDRYEQALALAELLQPREAFKINLIPYNDIGPARASPRPPARHDIGPARASPRPPARHAIGPARASPRPPARHPTDAGYRGSSREAIAAFRAALEERGVRATVRLTRGRDIDAACGQLAARA